MGFTVVGKPAATVITSSPGFRARSPSFGEVSALNATRFALEPEFTRLAERTPTNFASFRSKSLANRPVVNQASRAESTTEQMSSAPITLPDTGTTDAPGTNSRAGKASAWYSAVKAKICSRNCSERSLIDSFRIHRWVIRMLTSLHATPLQNRLPDRMSQLKYAPSPPRKDPYYRCIRHARV